MNKKSDNERVKHSLNITLTDAEYETLSIIQKESGMSKSAIIRFCFRRMKDEARKVLK